LKPKSNLLLITTGVASILSGCGIETPRLIQDSSAMPATELGALVASPTTPVNYSQVNQAVFKPSCVACHGAGYAAAGVRVDTYSAVIANLNGIKTTSIISKTMPTSGPLSQNQMTLLSNWIDQGAPETQVVATPTATPFPEPGPTVSPTPIASPTPGVNPNSPVNHRRRYQRFLNFIRHWLQTRLELPGLNQ
jgi:mono/diheme cytochrome c family protein